MLRNRKHIAVAAVSVLALSAVLGTVLTFTLRSAKESKDVKSPEKKEEAPKEVGDEAKDEASLKGAKGKRSPFDATVEDMTLTGDQVSLRDALSDGTMTQVKSDLLNALDHAVSFFGGVAAEAGVGGNPGAQVSKLFDVDAQKATNLMSRSLDELKKIRLGFYKVEQPKLVEVEAADPLKPDELADGLKELPMEVSLILKAAYDYTLSYKMLLRSFRDSVASGGSFGAISDGLSGSCSKVTADLDEILEIAIRHWNIHEPPFGENFKQVLDWLLLFRTEDGVIKLRRWIVVFGDWLTGYAERNRNDPLVENFRKHIIRWTAKSIVSQRVNRSTANKNEPIPASRTEELRTQRIENFVIGMFTDFATLLTYIGRLLGVDALTSEVKLERCDQLIPIIVEIMGEFLDPFVKEPEEETEDWNEEDVLKELIPFVFEQYGQEIHSTEYEGKMTEAKNLRRHMQVLSQNLNYLRPFLKEYRKELFA